MSYSRAYFGISGVRKRFKHPTIFSSASRVRAGKWQERTASYSAERQYQHPLLQPYRSIIHHLRVSAYIYGLLALCVAVHNSGSIATKSAYKFATSQNCSVDIQAYCCRHTFIQVSVYHLFVFDNRKCSVVQEGPIMSPSLSDLADVIKERVTDLQPGNETQRMSLLQSARDLVTSLEKPHERIMRMIYLEAAVFTTTKILIDLGIFKTLAESKEPLSGARLAEDSGADPSLMERLLKLIAVERFVHETGPDTYTANDITRCIALPGPQGAIEDMFQSERVLAALPDFLRETKYANPTDKDNSAWKYGYQTEQHYFEYINTAGREKNLEAFRNHMAFKTVGLKWYEVPEIMDSVFGNAKYEMEDVLLIDVGGSGGHDLIEFHKAHLPCKAVSFSKIFRRRSCPLIPPLSKDRALSLWATTSSHLNPFTARKCII